ncbi:MAG TPA: DUF86 domain-containing protein [Bacillota bacterium]|nr:DUF86 domain-containing protein [Bacillota bacterium]
MYFVDRKEIKKKLAYMDETLKILPTINRSSSVEKYSLERMVQIMIETIIDVGHLMIDGFIMRDAGSYKDIITILVDEKVLQAEDEIKYHQLIDLREMIVNQYDSVDHERIFEQLEVSLPAIKHFSTHINNYLHNELDVANAFQNPSE